MVNEFPMKYESVYAPITGLSLPNVYYTLPDLVDAIDGLAAVSAVYAGNTIIYTFTAALSVPRLLIKSVALFHISSSFWGQI